MIIYVLSHKADILYKANVSEPEYFKVDLSGLHKGTKLNSNLYGEGRAFNCGFDIQDITGFANARWNSKYSHLMIRLEGLVSYIRSVNIQPNEVYVPWSAQSGWLRHTLNVHPTMDKLLKELSEFSGLPLDDSAPTFWANDMVASGDIIRSWLEFWRKCFAYFDGKYGTLLPMMYHNMDPSRGPAYFYERVTALYFASRKDLKIIQIP